MIATAGEFITGAIVMVSTALAIATWPLSVPLYLMLVTAKLSKGSRYG